MIDTWEIALIALGNLMGGYFLVTKLLRGAGRILAVVLGVLLGGLAWEFPMFGKLTLVLLTSAVIGVIVWESRHHKEAAYSQLIFEGGGIRRGLTPVEVGSLLGVGENGLLAVSVTTLLQKGILERGGQADGELRVNPVFQAGKDTINPVERTQERKRSSRKHSQVLSTEEELLLELFWQNIPPNSENFPIQLWVEKAAQECEIKLGGYDRSQSRVYYHNYMAHRFEGVEKGFFPREEFVPWLVLDFFTETQDETFLRTLTQKTRPAWLHEDESLFDWAVFFQRLTFGDGS